MLVHVLPRAPPDHELLRGGDPQRDRGRRSVRLLGEHHQQEHRQEQDRRRLARHGRHRHRTLGIALDATNVYFTDGSGTIDTCPKTSSATTQLASGQGNPQGIAVDATHVYWVNNAGGANGVMAVPVGGGTAVPLAAASAPVRIAVDATSLYFTDAGAVMKLWPK